MSTSPAAHARVTAEPGLEERGRELAARLGLPFGAVPARVELRWTGAGLGVRPASGPDAGATPWTVELQRGRPGGEAVVRAVRGRERAEGLRVVDATAGLGGDAGALVRAGMRVDAIERDPLLLALLEDALERWRGTDPEAAGRFTLWHGDARDLLPTVRPAPDVVLLDPMFPAGGGGAAKRRPAAWLRAWAGPRSEADEVADRALLRAARRTARRRIVVKRPRRGPELAPGTTGRRLGTTVRFDLYPPLAPS